MKKITRISLLMVTGILFFSVSASAVSAALLKFDNSSYTGAVGSTFTVNVVVDPGSDPISGTTANITYDPAVLQAQSVTPSSYFPSVSKTISSGRVVIDASTSDAANPKTTAGTIAAVTFVVLKNGSSNLQYYCDKASSTSSKILKNDFNATDVIVCSQNGSATVTAGTGGTSGGGSSGGGTSGGGTSGGSNPLATPTPVSTLPVTGAAENIMAYSILGIILIAAGTIAKILI